MCVVGYVASTGTIGTLATGVGAIVALPLGIVSVAVGTVGLIGSTVQKIWLRKLEKHDRLLTLAEAKLSTINGLVSKGLMDNHVTDEEFKTVSERLMITPRNDKPSVKYATARPLTLMG
jgi:hypothetical protein